MSSATATARQFATPSYSFARPADTTAYASGDLVANNTAAASVVPMSWTAALSGATKSGYESFAIVGVRLSKSAASVTNAQFRIHLFSTTPTFTSAGDNGVFATVVATGAGAWLGSVDVTMAAATADGAAVNGTFAPDIPVVLPSGSTVYGLIEARGAYTPASGETFTCTLLVAQN